MTHYTVEPERHTLHGSFSRDFAPILTIDPGDTVRFRTLDAGWNLDPSGVGSDANPAAKFAPRSPSGTAATPSVDPLRFAVHYQG